MPEFNYPPTRTYRLEAALDDVKQDLRDAEARVEDLEGDEDAQEQAVAEAYRERNQLEDQRDALQWAVDEFSADAEVTLEAFTATTRARTLDTVNQKTVGRVGSEETRVWLIAASIADAPWLDGSEDLPEKYQLTGALPPAVQDWLDSEVEDINDLSSGNS